MGPWILALGCVGAPTSDTGDTAIDSGTSTWRPLAWQDCEDLLDVGSLPPLDEQMVFRPSVVGDRLWFSAKGVDTPQSIAVATLTDPVTVDGVDVWVQGFDLGTFDVSSPAAVTRPDGGTAVFFDAWEDGLGLGLWRCDVDADGRPGTCAGVLPQGTHGDLDATSAHIPAVHVDDDGSWRLWYTGMDPGGVRRILASTSEDGWAWSAPELAVDIGDAGSWDDSSAYSPFVWRDATGWRLLYAGRAEHEGYLVKRLIEARSSDAVTWTDHTLTLDLGCAGDWDAWRVDSPWVVPEGEGWRLYYDGFDDPLTEVGVRRLLTATAY